MSGECLQDHWSSGLNLYLRKKEMQHSFSFDFENKIILFYSTDNVFSHKQKTVNEP